MSSTAWLENKRNQLPDSTILAGTLDSFFLKLSKEDSQTLLLLSSSPLLWNTNIYYPRANDTGCYLVGLRRPSPSPQRPWSSSVVIQSIHVQNAQTERKRSRWGAHRIIQIKCYRIPRRGEIKKQTFPYVVGIDVGLEKREEIVKYTENVPRYEERAGNFQSTVWNTVRNPVRRKPMKGEECCRLWWDTEVGLWRPWIAG